VTLAFLAGGTGPKWLVIITLSVSALWFASLGQKPLKGGPVSVVHLELAPTVRAADHFMEAWQTARPNWRDELIEAQGWDTWLICSYAPLFALLCWIAADHLTPRFRGLGSAGHALAAAQLLAGALDFVENAAMQTTIEAGHATAPWPLIGATASSMKWLLLLAFLLYAVSAGLHWAITFHWAITPSRP
jgi:hypothetical protein